MSEVFQNYLSSNCKIQNTANLEAPLRIYGDSKVKKRVKIGRFSYINDRTTIRAESTIGRYCSIGKNVEIGRFENPSD